MSIWRPHTTNILIGGLVVILIAIVASFVLTNFKSTTEVRIGSGIFNARVADDEASREKGLSGVKKLDPSDALLFVFESDYKWGIWMKDMEIPIDIVWLNKDKKVVHMVIEADPKLSTSKTFTPTVPARYVLELPAGKIKQSGIKIGESALFTLKDEK